MTGFSLGREGIFVVANKVGESQACAYPRTVQRPDGKLVTIYYVVEKKARKVTATIWDPGKR